jgi:uncharacterized membrane protein HdeD (DUF308 family)
MDDAPAWYVPVARAAPALVLAVVITFTPDHSAALGLLTFGIFAVLTGAVLTAYSLRSTARGVSRSLTLTQGLVTVAAGVASLALVNGGLPYFVFLLTAWAAITGFLELYLGLRSPRSRGHQTDSQSVGTGERGSSGRARSSRDWVFAGALTALLAIVVLLVPPGFTQSFTGPDGVERALTASVIVVGGLGAYWAILGVYLVIAGLSLKWAQAPETIEA